MTSSTPGYSKFIDEDDPIFNPSRAGKRQGLGSVDEFGEVFGGKAKYSSTPDIVRRGEDFDFENMFGAPPADAKGSGPVFDKPMYDDDGEESVFAGPQQMKGSGPANFENVFAGSGSNPFDDLLVGVNAGGVMGSTKSFNNIDASSVANGVSNFDDLLPGFGGSSPASASGSLPPYEEYVPSYRHSPSTTTLHNIESPDEIWFTVSEIPLFTQPTSAPPPSRPPPPIPATAWKMDTGAKSRRTNVTDFSSFYKSTQNSQTFKSGSAATRSSANEVEDFAKDNTYDHSSAHTGFDEDWLAQSDAAASAAAMKEAMNRAEVKFRQAKELKERENAKGCRNKENSTARYNGENLDCEQKIKEEDELEKKRFEQERKKARELEQENDRVQRRLEIERERAREETEQVKHAVQRATREARERAAADALLRAEKAAANKANSEARERAERLAVQRAQAEARERAAAEAKEKAERAAAEAKARSNAEAKERAAKAGIEARTRAERAAVDRASKEARERASAHARERVAAQARERATDTRASQQKPEDDFDSFFSSGSRPSSAPRATTNNSDFSFSPQFQTKQGSEAARGTSSGSPSIRKVSSTTNFVDDLSSIFGGSPQSRSFQEVEGETKERSRARLERHQRTNERATKAVAEMNERDLQAQREQAERQRFSETLDAEIKRWAAGKQGNLRALLSTMQYILWPEFGWQPVSLSDLISGASVKKVYRKATLCVHPDKVQQKGANLQQKYIAEKVFDLLKEAWNKFNSEELF